MFKIMFKSVLELNILKNDGTYYTQFKYKK